MYSRDIPSLYNLKWVRTGCTQTASCHEVKSRNERIVKRRVKSSSASAFKDDMFALLLSTAGCLYWCAHFSLVPFRSDDRIQNISLPVFDYRGVKSVVDWLILFCYVCPHTVSSLFFCFYVPPSPILFIWQCSSPWKSKSCLHCCNACFYLHYCKKNNNN